MLLRGRSIRTHMMVMVLVGAILPLALIGAWVTRSAVRSGRMLLQAQLTASAQAIATGIDEAWRFRRGELLLLADNTVAQRVFSGSAFSSSDSLYLLRLQRELAPAIASFLYRDESQRVRWSTVELPATPTAAGSNRVRPTDIGYTLPSHDSLGRVIGTLEARLTLNGLGADSARLSVPGAVYGVRELSTGTVLTPGFDAAILADTGQVQVAGTPWIAVRQSITEPPLDVTVAAPIAAYVDPFAHAGNVGLVAVAVVALAVLVLSVVLTAQIVAPLERLVGASTAVSRGDLARRVETQGPAEIAALGASFNAMTDSLKRSMDELSERSALAAVGEFASSLAHEVRNALTSVKVDLQRAEEKIEPETANRELVSRSLATITNLDSIVTGALRVARGGSVAATAVDLRTVLRSAAGRAAPTFEARSASLHVAEETTALCVRGDADSLEQLFLNLLLNAAQALPPGGEACVSTNANNGCVEVAVTDNGAGIDPAILPRVLDPFFTTRSGGTGLGLPIARQIAIAHGGELLIESSVGGGTVVRVRLPVVSAAG